MDLAGKVALTIVIIKCQSLSTVYGIINCIHPEEVCASASQITSNQLPQGYNCKVYMTQEHSSSETIYLDDVLLISNRIESPMYLYLSNQRACMCTICCSSLIRHS